MLFLCYQHVLLNHSTGDDADCLLHIQLPDHGEPLLIGDSTRKCENTMQWIEKQSKKSNKKYASDAFWQQAGWYSEGSTLRSRARRRSLTSSRCPDQALEPRILHPGYALEGTDNAKRSEWDGRVHYTDYIALYLSIWRDQKPMITEARVVKKEAILDWLSND